MTFQSQEDSVYGSDSNGITILPAASHRQPLQALLHENATEGFEKAPGTSAAGPSLQDAPQSEAVTTPPRLLGASLPNEISTARQDLEFPQ